MVVHLNRLSPYQGTVQDERPQGGSSWRVITVRSEPLGRKARPITDVTSATLGKKKWRHASAVFRTNSLKEGAMWLCSCCEKLVAEAGDSSETQRKGYVRRWKPLASNG
jgi:hypothetical protein